MRKSCGCGTSLGGSLGLLEVEAYLHGLSDLPGFDRDVLAHAVNERLDELTWHRRAPYTRTVREAAPRGAALTALTTLLEGAELAPPERLPKLAAAAGEVLGVGLTVYLADYGQRYLRPVPPPGTEPGSPDLEVDTTLAGRAFRRLEILPAETVPPRLWVPLLDGAERLGVLRADLVASADLYDPGLRTQCRWAALLIGHLVVQMTKYGDGLDVTRHRRVRTVAGELIWSLLPPLTAGIDGFVVSGAVEPRHAIAGDTFDYSLAEDTARLLILDAVGHDLRSGLIAATAVAAYRAARHTGRGLYEQARYIDEAISGTFGDTGFATAILAEVDLPGGRLRYVNAGHPPPRIMRDGRVVKPSPAAAGCRSGSGPATSSSSAKSACNRRTGWCCTPTASPRHATARVSSSAKRGSRTSSNAKPRPATRRRRRSAGSSRRWRPTRTAGSRTTPRCCSRGGPGRTARCRSRRSGRNKTRRPLIARARRG